MILLFLLRYTTLMFCLENKQHINVVWLYASGFGELVSCHKAAVAVLDLKEKEEEEEERNQQ